MTTFKNGDKVRCIDISGARVLTHGAVYTVTGSDCSPVLGNYVTLAEVSVGAGAEGFYERRFELVKEDPQGVEQNISTEFEIRWHRSKGAGVRSCGPMSGRVISRRPTQKLAEEFIENNAGNYADGEFSITQVTVLKRVQQVRRVKRVTKTVHELVDA